MAFRVQQLRAKLAKAVVCLLRCWQMWCSSSMGIESRDRREAGGELGSRDMLVFWRSIGELEFAR